MIVKIVVAIILALLALFFIFTTAFFLLIGAGILAAMLYIGDIFFTILFLTRRKKWD